MCKAIDTITVFKTYLSGGDLRSIGKSNSVIALVKSQKTFDGLFSCLFHSNRLVVMRAADAIEKITVSKPHYLDSHKSELFDLAPRATDKELLWHIALLLPRLPLDAKDQSQAWRILMHWATDVHQSKIVRVNSVDGLFQLTKFNPKKTAEFKTLMQKLEREHIPSLNARIKKLSNQLSISSTIPPPPRRHHKEIITKSTNE